MVHKSTHFELFLRKNPKGEWKLADAREAREQALSRAKELSEAHPHGGVKVMKEAQNPKTGDFSAIVVAKFGDCDDPKKSKARRASDVPQASCLRPSDLFKAASRKTIAVVLAPFLKRHRLLPCEAVFRPDVVEQLEASGMEITQAIQKVAISRTDGDDLHATVRQLHELVSQAVTILLRDHKKNLLPTYGQGKLDQIAAACSDKGNATYLLTYALVDGLRGCASWGDKLSRLIAMWEDASSLPQLQREAIEDILRHIFDEWLKTPSALETIVIDAKTPGQAVDWLIRIVEHNADWGSDNAIALSKAIETNVMPGAKDVLLGAILKEIGSGKRLIPGDLAAEVGLLRDFGDRLVRIVPPRDQRTMVTAFEDRSNRLVALDAIEEHLLDIPAFDRPARLIELSDNLVGTTARDRLTAIIRGEISNPKFERAVLASDESPLSVLKALGGLQRQVLATKLNSEEGVLTALDVSSLGARLASNTNLFPSIAKRDGPPLEKSAALFQLAGHELPKGPCAHLAYTTAMKVLSSQDGRAQLTNQPSLKVTLQTLSQTASSAANWSG